MTDRPSARDLALDAIDDAFKQAIVQFAKNLATGADRATVMTGVERVAGARNDMVQLVADAWPSR